MKEKRKKNKKERKRKGTKALYKNGISQSKSTWSLFKREAVGKRTREERNRKQSEEKEEKRREEGRIVDRLFRFYGE